MASVRYSFKTVSLLPIPRVPLTDVEGGYAQIEKEMLSIVHACNKFHPYIFGKEVTVYNDHKPLEQILKKPLLAAPMRL